MNIRMDHDRLQLFISFQHAGYEVVASEQYSHAHHWGFPDYEPVVEVLSGTLTWQLAEDDGGRDVGSSVRPWTVVDPPRRRFLQMFCGSVAETLV